MALYLRILRYLRPHGSYFVLAVLATFAYAGLDAVSYVLLIPFVRARFADDGADLAGAGVPADASAPMDRFLDVTVYRIVDLDGDPLAAVQGIIILILVAFTLKNVFDFVRAWLVARVEQG
ncbi:MAG: hypothetical protein KJP18_15200, partial [Gemmatimonadetes bacterium]|nr:hypothetical protein [Gemmatimonadota bacterium]